MTDTEQLEAWWTGLSDAERAGLLPLRRGDSLPAGADLPALTRALDIGPVGMKWEQQQGFDFYVDERLAEFLESKRG